jgi:beta-glucosidase
VQLYVRDPESVLVRPDKELKGFTRLEMEPGASGTARMTLDMRSFAYFDDQRDAWVADAGEFEILVGAASDDIRLCASVRLTSEWVESAQDTWRSAMI